MSSTMNMELELKKLRIDMDEIRKTDVALFKSFAKLQESIARMYLSETLDASSSSRPDHNSNTPESSLIMRQFSSPISRHNSIDNSPIARNKRLLRHFSFTTGPGSNRPTIRRHRSMLSAEDSQDDSFDDFDDALSSPNSECGAYEMIFMLATEKNTSFNRLDEVKNPVYEEALKTSISQWKCKSASASIQAVTNDVTNGEMSERSAGSVSRTFNNRRITINRENPNYKLSTIKQKYNLDILNNVRKLHTDGSETIDSTLI